jgi:hypothetical protein
MPTADDIYRALRIKYSDTKHWIYLEELRIGTGYGKSAEQSFDAWVMSAYPSDSMVKIAFEVKVSRSDFIKEIKKPLKRRWALRYSNKFYFAAPEGMIKPEELPLECGLMELHGDFMNTKVDAPWRESFPPSWGMIASIARRTVQKDMMPHIKLAHLSQTVKGIRTLVEKGIEEKQIQTYPILSEISQAEKEIAYLEAIEPSPNT